MSKTPIDPGDWSHESEALFRAARTEHAPTAADRARVRSALAQRLVASATAPSAGADTRVSSGGTSAATTSKLVKLGVGVACVVIGAVVFVRGGNVPKSPDAKPHDQKPHTAETIPARRVTAQSAIAPSDAVQPGSRGAAANAGNAPAAVAATPIRARPLRAGATPETAKRPAPSAPTPARASSAAAPDPATLPGTPSPSTTAAQPGAAPADGASTDSTDARAELAFMARINAAMVAAKANVVLALCAEHARRWPEGTFVQEREALRAIASCDSRAGDASARARAFLTRYAHSSLAPRVRDECASLLGGEP